LDLLHQRLIEVSASLSQAKGPVQLAQVLSQSDSLNLLLEDHPWLQAAASHFPEVPDREYHFLSWPEPVPSAYNCLSKSPLSPPGERIRVTGAEGDFTHQAPADVDTLVTVGLGAVPETGSVLINSGSPAAFRLSLCPRRHIVVIPADRAALTMAEALALTAREPSGLVSWLTGPSRTADIEKVLVLGAQGASELLVIVYQET
jgi:hypothetical protein